MNSVLLIGRMAVTPELKRTNSGTPVTRFTLAVDREGKNKGADFISCVAWEKDAENICRYIEKGRQIAIRGRIQTGSYDKDGQKVYTTDVVIEKAEFLGSREEPKDEPYEDEYFPR